MKSGGRFRSVGRRPVTALSGNRTGDRRKESDKAYHIGMIVSGTEKRDRIMGTTRIRKVGSHMFGTSNKYGAIPVHIVGTGRKGRNLCFTLSGSA